MKSPVEGSRKRRRRRRKGRGVIIIMTTDDGFVQCFIIVITFSAESLDCLMRSELGTESKPESPNHVSLLGSAVSYWKHFEGFLSGGLQDIDLVGDFYF